MCSCRVLLCRLTTQMIYSGFSLSTGLLAGNIYVNTLLVGIVDIPGNFLAILGLRSRYFGRKLTCALGLLIAGCSSLLTIPFIITGICTYHSLLQVHAYTIYFYKYPYMHILLIITGACIFHALLQVHELTIHCYRYMHIPFIVT